MNINDNITETDIDNIDVKSQLNYQIQIQETKDSSWIFDENDSMKNIFYKTGELNGSSFVKKPIRSALKIFKSGDKKCFIWSILAKLRPCENYHPNSVSKYRQYFNELNLEGFDFTNGFNCSHVHKFERLNNLSNNMFESKFYQGKNNWKQNLIPIAISKNISDRFVDLLIYKNHYALIKKINAFLRDRDHHKNFISRRCLNSYTSENMLMIQKPKCKNYDITSITTSNESHLSWKKHFHKNPLHFRIYAVFEADNEIHNSSIINKTTSIHKQNPMLNGYFIETELNDVLRSGYCRSLLG